MARIRTIKPEFWTSAQVVECSRDARLLFIGLWNFCDDAGRHPASALRLKMEVLPGDSVSTEEVTRWVRELVDAGLLDEYEFEEELYWEVTGWCHQRIDQPNVRHPSREGKVEPISPRRLGGKQRQLAFRRLVERDGERCCNCGATRNLAVDHIVPVSRGGTNKMDNLRLLCKLCNSEKGAKVRDSDAPGTLEVRDSDSPPEGKGMECNGMEGTGGEGKKPPIVPQEGTGEVSTTPPRKVSRARTVPVNVQAVIDHYRIHHPKARPGDKERRLVAARLKDGFSVADLSAAIDGCHRSPHNQGENERGRTYQTLELIMRSSSKVTQFMETPEAQQGEEPYKEY